MSLDGPGALSARDLDTLRGISLLDNLSVLRCHHDDGPSAGFSDDYMVDKFDAYRGTILSKLIVGLCERGRTSRKLETLDIVNHPCRTQPDLTTHQSFSTLLGTLKTLLLRFDYK